VGVRFGVPPPGRKENPMAKAHTHGKNAATGQGHVDKAPQSGAKGPSNHTPTIGKPQPGSASNYSSEQQQQ